jgi:phosphonate degradation associated HDIG domain protein
MSNPNQQSFADPPAARESAVLRRIEELFRTSGASMYAGEPVTQLEHALQAASLAETQGAKPALIAAALLHDVGHLMHSYGEDCADEGIDDEHEAEGARWLANYFGAEVVEPIRLHVMAKRYLCCVDSVYYGKLSDASRKSLALQGGPLTASEAQDFERNPHFLDALRLRGWDESAKERDFATPPLEHYLVVVAACLNPAA